MISALEIVVYQKNLDCEVDTNGINTMKIKSIYQNYNIPFCNMDILLWELPKRGATLQINSEDPQNMFLLFFSSNLENFQGGQIFQEGWIFCCFCGTKIP